jgi:hypothetical protein
MYWLLGWKPTGHVWRVFSFYSILLAYVTILILVSYYFNYCSFVGYFEVEKGESYIFIFWQYLGLKSGSHMQALCHLSHDSSPFLVFRLFFTQDLTFLLRLAWIPSILLRPPEYLESVLFLTGLKSWSFLVLFPSSWDYKYEPLHSPQFYSCFSRLFWLFRAPL